MTDLFRGYDLTTVADEVARKHYERIHAVGGASQPWNEVDRYVKQQFKTNLLPIITDVLEALESDQVKPTEGRQMTEYGYEAGDRTDPRWYENQYETMHDLSICTVWALHLNVPDGEDVKERILERMSVLSEPTGEYTYGDSFKEWCEPRKGPNDTHMVIYFHATPDRAQSIGAHLADHASFAATGDRVEGFATLPYNVTTSGDYAMQLGPLG